MAKKEYDQGDKATVTISKLGYTPQIKTYVMNDDITDEVMLDLMSIIPLGYTITWKSRSVIVINFTVTAYKNGEVFALTARSNSQGEATLDGFARGDTVSWTARSSTGNTDMGTLVVGGGIVIDIF